MTKEQVKDLLYEEDRVKYKEFVIEHKIECGCGCNDDGKYIVYYDGDLLKIHLITEDMDKAIDYFINLIGE